MKTLYYLFRRIPYLGKRYTVLAFAGTVFFVCWTAICLLIFSETTTQTQIIGYYTAVFTLHLLPALFLIDLCNTWTKGLANRWIRVSLKTLLVGGAFTLIGYGIYHSAPLLPYVQSPYWPTYLEQHWLVLTGTIGVPIVFTLAIPFIYHQLAKFADYRFFRKHLKNRGGSAQWAGPGTFADKRLWYNPFNGGRTTKMVLGANRYMDDPKIKTIAVKSESHELLCATMGSGKSATYLYTNQANYAGSIIVNDPKGEHARTLYARRSQQQGSFKGECYMLDPFGVNADTGIPAVGYNPLSEIDIHDDNAKTLINAIAEACVPNEQNDKPHFVQVPRSVLAGLIAHVLSTYPKENHNLPFILDLLYGTEQIDKNRSMLNFDAFKELLLVMMSNNVCGGLAQRAARDLKMVGHDELGSMLSSLSRSLGWVGNPVMRKHLTAPSAFKFRDIGINGKDSSIFIVYPFGEEEANSRWMRTLFNVGISLMRSRKQRPKKRILLVLDEFASLGAMESIKSGIANLREAKIKVIAVVQNIAQLKGHFGVEWSNFWANSNKICFGIADNETAEEISKAIGDRMIRGKTYRLISPAEIITDLSKDSNRLIYLSATATRGRDNLPMLLERMSYKYYSNDFRHHAWHGRHYTKAGVSSQYMGVATKRKFFVFSFHPQRIFSRLFNMGGSGAE